MKNILDFFPKIPIVWHIIFFIIATVNLSAPLIVNEVHESKMLTEEISAGLNAIHTDMFVRNGQLTAQTEIVKSEGSAISISVLGSSKIDTNYLHFQEDSIKLNINNSSNQIKYEQNMDKDSLVTSVQEQIASAAMISILTNSFVYILMSVVLFLILLIVSHYLIKSTAKFRSLFRILNPVYLVGGSLSMMLTLLTDKFHLVYMISVLIIGFLYAGGMKNNLKKSTNDFYFGKGENFNGLY
ncbi:hypothetical protein E1I69_05385 [Bacillus timonensis]|uniref:DUF1189 domain-containing protein n=1 Tax=Bacillus timonensis TaxID=1033734 RepID=A0A4S3PVT8_9BACI|nr:hypothetical protein [Bacillus timonensis]THE13940.1 hypothetical protein E1I69_05385 [Bacillus timonensis]